MMRKRILIILLLMVLLIAGVVWLRGSYLAARWIIAVDLTAEGLDGPALKGTEFGGIAVNTFTHDLSSSDIASLYEAGCRRLDSIRGDRPMETYAWDDVMGYPRLATVVQGPAIYIKVQIGKNNDNDSFKCRYGNGVYDATDKTRLSNWAIPPGTLRQDD